MSTKSKFALGAVVGAVAGIIAGVLTAPKSGKETRTSIKDKAVELKQKSLKKATDARKRSENPVDSTNKGFKTKK